MQSQTVYEFQSAALPTVQGSTSSNYFVPGSVISICESPAFSRREIDEAQDSNPDGLGCARGIRSAFLLEAGLALLTYGIWHLWHIAR